MAAFVPLAAIALALFGVAFIVAQKLGLLAPKVALDPIKYQKFSLINKTNVSHNTRKFVFALQTPKTVLGLPVGQHMSIKAVVGGNTIMRSYTPTSSDDNLGYFSLVVKIYPDGMMSKYLDALKIGDKIDVKGPMGKFAYKGNGKYERKVGANWVPNTVKSIGMVAGGTGITPMYQIIQDILKHQKDQTQVSLIFANVTEDDILLRSELEKLEKSHSNFKLFLTLDKPGPEWKFGAGYVTAEMMKTHLPAPEESILLFCGPPPMMGALEKNAKSLGYPESGYFIF